MKRIIDALTNVFYYYLLKVFHPCFYNYKKLSKSVLFCNSRCWSWRIAYRYLKLNKKQSTNLKCDFPVSHLNTIINCKNIEFDINDINNFYGSGKYYQAYGIIHIGKGTWIANNVAIITANHNFDNLKEHQKPEDVFIGDNCWIGINSVILPGVYLGNNTIVGAGSVVTHSFEKGSVVIAGNPAKAIKIIS